MNSINSPRIVGHEAIYFAFKVDCFKYKKSPDKWVVRTHQDEDMKWQINNLMINSSGVSK